MVQASQHDADTVVAGLNSGTDGLKDAQVNSARETYGLNVEGLMCIPPAAEAPEPHFVLLAQIAARNGLSVLSMGMSSDYQIAISCGATHVRVGSALFGERNRPLKPS